MTKLAGKICYGWHFVAHMHQSVVVHYVRDSMKIIGVGGSELNFIFHFFEIQGPPCGIINLFSHWFIDLVQTVFVLTKKKIEGTLNEWTLKKNGIILFTNNHQSPMEIFFFT